MYNLYQTNFIRTIVCLAALLLLNLAALAQTGSIQGHVSTSDGHAASFVNIYLKEISKGTASEENGNYLLKNVKAGTYTIISSLVGLQTQEKTVSVEAGKVTSFDFILQESGKQLSEVQITTKRSLNERPVSIGKIAIRPMDLPQSVVTINQEVLEQQQTLRLSEVLQNVNGVYQMGSTGGFQEEIASRGFAMASSNTFKNGSRFNNAIMPEMSSLEKVEVLKGSNAILFGNVAAGGILNLVTKKPKFENGGEISLRTGSYDLYKPTVDLYGAVNNSQRVAYRVNSAYENAGSYRNSVKSERFYVNPSLLIKAGAKTDILLEGDYLKDNRTPDYGIGSINYEIANVPRDRFLGVAWGYNKVEQKSASATITHQLNENWQLRALSSVQDYDANLYTTTRPNASGALVKTDGTWNRSLQRTASSEQYFLNQLDLTGKFNTGFLGHTLLVGADADQYRTNANAFNIYADQKDPNKVSAAYDVINILNAGQYEQRTDIPAAKASQLTKSPIYRVGVYAQDLLTISEKLKVLAGLRYSYQDTRSIVYKIKTDGTLDQTAPTSKSFTDAFTPRLGLVYQPAKTTSLFASYANSFNTNTAKDTANKILNPSFTDQYELGIKNDLFNGLLSANLTVYQIVNSNLAQANLAASAKNQNPTGQELAGQVTSKGLEVDLMSKAYYGFTFMGGYSYNDTRYTKSSTYEKNSKLRYNPSNTANVSVFYAFNSNGRLNGLTAGFTSTYIGNRFAGRSTTAKNPEYKLIALPDYFQFDAHVGYTWKKVSVKVKVTNLANKLSYYAHDDNSINPIAPRQFATTISYKF